MVEERNDLSYKLDRITLVIADLAAGIAAGRIPLKVAEEFVASGRIDGAPGLPPIGTERSVFCFMCEKETSSILTIAPFDSAKPRGDQVIQWTCLRCRRNGPVIVRVCAEQEPSS